METGSTKITRNPVPRIRCKTCSETFYNSSPGNKQEIQVYIYDHIESIAFQGTSVLQFRTAGIALSLSQDGSGFSFMAESVYQYLSGKDPLEVDISLDELPDVVTRHLLDSVSFGKSMSCKI